MTSREFWKLAMMSVVGVLGLAQPIQAQYVGATFGFNDENDMKGT